MKSKKPAKKKVAAKPAHAKAVPKKSAPAKKSAPGKKGKALSHIEDYLTDRKVRYELIRHPKAYTAQEVAAAEHISGKKHVKVVVAQTGATFVLAALPAAARVDFKKLSAVVGKSCSLAKEAALKTLFPDCELGALPPFGSLYNLPLFADKLLAQNTEIAFAAGTYTDSLKISYADFVKLESPKLADFAQKPK